jgi:hypothetical protein
MRFSRPFAAALVAMTCLSLAPAATAAQRQPARSQELHDQAVVNTGERADEIRQSLDDMLKQYPPSLPRVLRMDPTLMDNPGYLQSYPALAAFLSQHPEVKHNPAYFFEEYSDGGGRNYVQTPQDRAIQMWRSTIEGFSIAAMIATVVGGLVWLIKTFVEHRRWARMSKVQTEVHTKLLDRFSSNEELLAYIQTPAGRRFLESAPISIDSPRAISAPLGRILWSAQAGAVLTVLGIGIEIVAQQAIEDVGGPMSALGAVIIALGVGFVVSAVLAYMLSRRFGLVNHPDAPASEPRG